MYKGLFMKKGIHHNRGGFTILELIVVISIIGILASFLYQKFAYREQAAKIRATDYTIMRYYEAAKAYTANHSHIDYTGITPAVLSADGLINTSVNNPWGNAYSCGPGATTAQFKVWTQVDTAATAQAIADSITNKGYTATVSTTTVTAIF